MNRDNATIDNIKQFTDQCFDRDSEKAASIIKGILDARSSRISDISNQAFRKSLSKKESTVEILVFHRVLPSSPGKHHDQAAT